MLSTLPTVSEDGAEVWHNEDKGVVIQAADVEAAEREREAAAVAAGGKKKQHGSVWDELR